MAEQFDKEDGKYKSFNFTYFSFSNSASFIDIDLRDYVLPLARAYDSVSPLVEGSIIIKYGEGSNIQNASTSLLINLLQAGTKPFDAIMYYAVLKNHLQDTHLKYFSPVATKVQTIQKMNDQIKVITACVLVLYTRGSFPGMNGSSATNPLPKFIVQMFPGSKLTSESKLKEKALSFDPKHLNLKSILLGKYYDAWDVIIANRLNLGIAGHKPLKLILDCNTRMNEGVLESVELLKFLFSALKGVDNGFYIGLHPIISIVGEKRPKFFLNCLHCIFVNMKGSNNEKYTFLLNLPYLRNETSLKNATLHNFAATWSTWDMKELSKEFGDVFKFTSENREKIKGKELIDLNPGKSNTKEGLNQDEFEAEESDDENTPKVGRGTGRKRIDDLSDE